MLLILLIILVPIELIILLIYTPPLMASSNAELSLNFRTSTMDLSMSAKIRVVNYLA